MDNEEFELYSEEEDLGPEHEVDFDALEELSKTAAIAKVFSEKSLVLSKEAVQKAIEAKSLEAKEGFTVKVNDADLSARQACSIVKAPAEAKNPYRPTAKQLEVINSTIAKTPKTADNCYVFEFLAAGQEIDRSFDQFTGKALRTMAKLAVQNKIPYLTEGDYDHQWRQKNIYGIVFNARVKGTQLIYDVYIPESERTEHVVEAIMDGLYANLSVGFNLSFEDYLCSECRKSMFLSECPHYPGEVLKGGRRVYAIIDDVNDNFEISGVMVGAQREAHIMNTKSLQDGGLVKTIQALEEPEDSKYITINANEEVKLPSSTDISKLVAGKGITITTTGDTVTITAGSYDKLIESYGSPSSSDFTVIDEAPIQDGNSPEGTITLGNTKQDSKSVMENQENQELEAQAQPEEVAAPAEAAAEEVEAKVEEAPAAEPEVEPAAPEAEAKTEEVPINITAILEGLVEASKSVQEELKLMKEAVSAVNEKLELLQSTPTKSVLELEMDEKEQEKIKAMEALKANPGLALYEIFGLNNDFGGQDK